MTDSSTRQSPPPAGPPPPDDVRAELAALRTELAALRAERARREEQHGRARAELQQRLDQLHGIYLLSDTTGRAEDLEAIYGEALRCLTGTLGADRASVLLFDEKGRMRFKACAGLSERYRRRVDGHSPWTQDSQSPAPILIPDAAADASLGDLRATLREEGIAALGFIPLVNHGRLLGKLMIYYDRPHRFDEEQVQLSQAIAAHIAIAIDRKQREEVLAFLADASTQLGASLDYLTTLGTVGRIFVPRLGDWCAIYLLEAGRLRKVSVCHPDPALHPMIQRMHQRIPPDLYPGHPVRRLLVEGRPLVFHDLSDAELRAMCLDDEHLEQIQALGARARLCLPMHCRGKTLGAIVVNRGALGSRFSLEEQRHAEELAFRCAMAIDNARLHHETQEAVRAREEFLSIASHEIRAPLNTLHLQVQLLLRTLRKGQLNPADPERVAGMLEGADRQVRRLAELIDKLFDVSRIAAGKLALQPEEVDLAQLVRDAAARNAEELRQAGCELSVSIAPSCPGRWDRVRLDQVVTNLLANAMKYGAGKPISLSVEEGPRPGFARLVVTDGGIGIAKDQQEQIFERFERAAGRSYGGLGLGLYIVRKILHAMGGAIYVDSQLGQGSTFVVELPCDAPAPSEISLRPPVS